MRERRRGVAEEDASIPARAGRSNLFRWYDYLRARNARSCQALPLRSSVGVPSFLMSAIFEVKLWSRPI